MPVGPGEKIAVRDDHEEDNDNGGDDHVMSIHSSKLQQSVISDMRRF